MYRESYNALPWPSWVVSLAPDFTLFMPLTQRARSVYDTLPGMNDEENLQIPIIPPNYNTLATFPRRRRPPTPVDIDQSEHERFLSPLLLSDDSQHENNWDEKIDIEEEEKNDGRTIFHRYGFDTTSVFNRLQEVLDESDSDENSRIQRSEGNTQVHRNEENSLDRDLEMGSLRSSNQIV